MSLWANIKFFPEPTGELYVWLLATLVTVGNMRVMICLGQGGLHSLSASSLLFFCLRVCSELERNQVWLLLLSLPNPSLVIQTVFIHLRHVKYVIMPHDVRHLRHVMPSRTSRTSSKSHDNVIM